MQRCCVYFAVEETERNVHNHTEAMPSPILNDTAMRKTRISPGEKFPCINRGNKKKNERKFSLKTLISYEQFVLSILLYSVPCDVEFLFTVGAIDAEQCAKR